MSKQDWDKAVHQGSQERIAPLAYTIKEAAKLAGISRTRLYEEMNAGRLEAKKAGRCTLIPHESIETWLKNLQPYAASSGESRGVPKLDL